MIIRKMVDGLMRAIEITIMAALVVMVVLVFINVVMRYGFGKGLAVSDELSRYCFVWLVFLGAIVAMRQHAHLGMDTVVRMLPPAGKKICFVVSHCLMLYGCVVFFQGSWTHTVLGHANKSAITGIPMSWVTAAGVLSSAAIGVILVADLVRLALGRLSDAELMTVSEEQG
jgi:TRAP-type C4-dicarboxylate transport system permease small subunit